MRRVGSIETGLPLDDAIVHPFGGRPQEQTSVEPKKISLQHFARTGLLAEVAFGDDQARVRRVFGTPYDVSRCYEFAIERYARGRIEISFLDGYVVLIAVSLLQGSKHVNGMVVTNDFEPDVGNSVPAFERWLSAQGISFRVWFQDADSCTLELKGIGCAVFENGRFVSLQSNQRTPSAPTPYGDTARLSQNQAAPR